MASVRFVKLLVLYGIYIDGIWKFFLLWYFYHVVNFLEELSNTATPEMVGIKDRWPLSYLPHIDSQ